MLLKEFFTTEGIVVGATQLLIGSILQKVLKSIDNDELLQKILLHDHLVTITADRCSKAAVVD